MCLFLCFNKGGSNQADLEDFVEDNFTEEKEPITRQAFSKQRTYINPEVFKDINKGYLSEIGYFNNKNSFFKEINGFRIYADDGSDFELPDFKEVREEYQIKNTPLMNKPVMAKFSSVMDILNGYILDGIIESKNIGELPLMLENIKNISKMMNLKKSIFIFDRGYNAIELYCQLIALKSYFIVRLKGNTYKKERKNINKNDSPIKIKLTNERTKRFHDKRLQEQFKNTPYLNLRIITIELDNVEKETLLTNLPKTKFKTEEFKQLYHLRWGIETNYNTMKNRLNIENYTGKRKNNNRTRHIFKIPKI